MPTKKILRALLHAIFGGVLLALTMGQGCPMPLPIFPGPSPRFVDVVLVNDSGELVQPVLYADPRILSVPADIMLAANLVDIGPPLVPGEVASVRFTCDQAGSLLSDADVIELAGGTLLSSTLLRQGQEFFCGESVYIYYDPIPLPPPPVTVELTNSTSNLVDAFFWSDPGTLFDPDLVAIPANFVDIGPPLEPLETVTVTLECADAGTFLADGDLLLVPSGVLPSENLLLLNEGEHFLCGDIVSFYYEVDGLGGFFISVDVNDVYLAP